MLKLLNYSNCKFKVSTNLLSIIKSQSQKPLILSCLNFNLACNVDPFGIGDDEDKITPLIQGQFIGPAKGEEKYLINSKLERFESWIENTRKNDEVKNFTKGEVFYKAPFGSIRFDNKNPPNSNKSIHENQNSELIRNSNQLELTARELELTPDLLKPSSSIIDRINLEKKITSTKFPKIYTMDNLNDLTRIDMWLRIKESIIYENEHVIAINKPYGLPMHSPSKECRHTINDFLEELTTLSKSSVKVQPLHRLDKDTTGVLLFGKTDKSANIIKERFASRSVKKKYLSITKNCPPINQGTINIPISEGKVGVSSSYRSVLRPDLRRYKISCSQANCKEATTQFTVINTKLGCSFVEIFPITGLKHQIRVHLGMGLGCPILGDHKYSHREKMAPQRLSPSVLNLLKISQSKVRELPIHLHCSSIQFFMPDSLESVFVHARPPKFFIYTLRKLQLK